MQLDVKLESIQVGAPQHAQLALQATTVLILLSSQLLALQDSIAQPDRYSQLCAQ